MIQALGSEPVMLIAHSHGAAVALRYAGLHAERVSHLVVYGGFARGRAKRDADPAQAQETRAQREAIEAGWGSDLPYSAPFRRVFYTRFIPRASEALLAEFDASTCRRWSRAAAVGYSVAGWDIDVSKEAQRLACPSLIFHARHDQAFPFDEGRRLAALIPGSRFVPVESENHVPLESDPQWPALLQEVKTFLGFDESAPTLSSNRVIHSNAPVLTPRQIEVLRLVGQGQTDKQIARSLGLSPRTVEMHTARAMTAMGCHTRAEAVHKATSAGWLA